MAQNTGIEWCDHTWTPIVGCDAVSPACAKCYAALMAARLEAMGMEKYAGLATRVGNIGKWTGKVTLWEPDLVKPLKVKKPGRWFLTSMGDIFHKLVPDTFLDRAFDVMSQTPQHTYYVLTKRDERAAAYIAGRAPLPNVIVGCTAENQEQADLRRPSMAAIAAMGWRTFVSYEPALDLVDWRGWEFLSWLISGGESGHDARPSHPDWHRAARDFCVVNGIAFLFKQWGEWAPYDRSREDSRKLKIPGSLDSPIQRFGKKLAGRQLDGVTHDGYPA